MASKDPASDAPAETIAEAAPAAPAPDVAAEPIDPREFHQTLDEYCQRKSATAVGVEMLHGFRSDEIRNGNVKGAEADFDARLEAFANRPV